MRIHSGTGRNPRTAPYRRGAHTMKKYITYEEPLQGRKFTEQQMHEVYRDLADKKEYPVFSIWFLDMIRSGVFEAVTE